MTERFLIFWFAVSALAVSGEIPPYIKVCEQSVQNLSACITDSIEFLRPKLVEGIPEVDVPSMEPLPLEDLVIDSISPGSRLATNITDMKVYGASKFEIQKLVATKSKNGKTFRFQVNIPQLRVEAHYQLDSRILFLDLKGEGPFFANITNYWFDCTMKGNKVERDGKNYLLFERMRLNVVIGDVSILLGNLFDGSPVLSKATNAVINDNAHLLFDEIKPALVGTLEKVFTDMSNKITLKFEYEELFP
ncbi:uncharacterized protein LOC116162078 [Photinus pyralis]|uniref:Haemolymph juvenile hormone binding protein n=2 Tax=Photinus pyralis TaxID=7054 RepID=A0A1Y1JV16_PHOPY|nr:uncharacterized protein LOC116162078 [Photinus pyralis]